MNKTQLTLAGDLRQWIKKVKNSIFVSQWISHAFISIIQWDIGILRTSKTSRVEPFAKKVNVLKSWNSFSKALA